MTGQRSPPRHGSTLDRHRNRGRLRSIRAINAFDTDNSSRDSPLAGGFSAGLRDGSIPDIGSTGGGTNVRMTGTGFRPITAITVGGTKVSAFLEVASLAGGFVYRSPAEFDFNGDWEGG